MYKIFSLIAFFGLPLGERFANVLIKILRALGFVQFFGIPVHNERLEKIGDKLCKNLIGKIMLISFLCS